MSFGRTDPFFIVAASARAAFRNIGFGLSKVNGLYRAELVALYANLIAGNVYAHRNVAVVEQEQINFNVNLFSERRPHTANRFWNSDDGGCAIAGSFGR
jgi:hypothetical protein